MSKRKCEEPKTGEGVLKRSFSSVTFSEKKRTALSGEGSARADTPQPATSITPALAVITSKSPDCPGLAQSLFFAWTSVEGKCFANSLPRSGSRTLARSTAVSSPRVSDPAAPTRGWRATESFQESTSRFSWGSSIMRHSCLHSPSRSEPVWTCTETRAIASWPRFCTLEEKPDSLVGSCCHRHTCTHIII